LLLAEVGVAEADRPIALRRTGRKTAQRDERCGGRRERHRMRAREPLRLAIAGEVQLLVFRRRERGGRQQPERQQAERPVRCHHQALGIAPRALHGLQQ
jgi:hypothetical protein